MKFRDDVKSGGSGGDYVKLKDKESIIGVLRGELFDYQCVWDGKQYREVKPGTAGASFRFKANFVVKDGSGYTAKILEQGATMYNQLREINKEYSLETTVIKITRNGTGTDTEYSVLPLLKQVLSKEALAYISSMKLNEFGPQKASQSQNFEDEFDRALNSPADDIPFPGQDDEPIPF